MSCFATRAPAYKKHKTHRSHRKQHMVRCQKWASTFYLQGLTAHQRCSIPWFPPCASPFSHPPDACEKAMARGRPPLKWHTAMSFFGGSCGTFAAPAFSCPPPIRRPSSRAPKGLRDEVGSSRFGSGILHVLYMSIYVGWGLSVRKPLGCRISTNIGLALLVRKAFDFLDKQVSYVSGFIGETTLAVLNILRVSFPIETPTNRDSTVVVIVKG